jgi:hypothetical protein
VLDLTKEMHKIGGYFQVELQQSLEKQIDLDGRRFWPVTYKTAQARQRRSNAIHRLARAKGVKGRIPGTVAVRATTGAVNQQRLLFTRRLVAGAFRYAANKDSVKVMLWPGTYPESDVSFRDIIRWNNRGDSTCTIKNSPKVFPLNPKEVEKMAAYAKGVKDLSLAVMSDKMFRQGFRRVVVVQF